MKKLLTLIVMVVFILAIFNSCELDTNEEEKEPDDFYTYIYLKRDMYSVYTKQCDIVFLGDSLTSEVKWHELLNRNDVANRGIGGDISGNIYNRIDDIYLLNPQKVFLMCGINDIRMGVDIYTIFSNIKKIHEDLKNNGVELIITSTLYVAVNKNDYKKKNTCVYYLNNMLREYCIEENIVFIELNEQLSDNLSLKPEYTYDGVHLYSSAYAIYRDLLVEHL